MDVFEDEVSCAPDTIGMRKKEIIFDGYILYKNTGNVLRPLQGDGS
jgi:hypothetical protein